MESFVLIYMGSEGICMVLYRNEFSCGLSEWNLSERHSRIGHICNAFPQYDQAYVL